MPGVALSFDVMVLAFLWVRIVTMTCIVVRKLRLDEPLASLNAENQDVVADLVVEAASAAPRLSVSCMRTRGAARI